jgi:SAM-dependent methyltransferase
MKSATADFMGEKEKRKRTKGRMTDRKLMKEKLQSLAERLLQVSARRKMKRLSCRPPVGFVRFGSLRRLRPISADWGSDRGDPVDRYYIEKFLSENSADIRGHVLEIGTNRYTKAFGDDRVTRNDVLHVAEEKPEVTIIGDLTAADHIPSNIFDCIILTQTLQFIYDVPAALKTAFRILKPGGVMLVTVPGISKISRYDMDRWGHYWAFTSLSIRKIFQSFFPADSIWIQGHGNVLTAVAFLHGVSAQELRKSELVFVDEDYEVLISVRAVKPEFRV